ADAAEIEPQGRETAPREGLIDLEHDAVVHGPALLRVRMKHQRDRGVRAPRVIIAPFQPAIGTVEDDFGHDRTELLKRKGTHAPLLMYRARIRPKVRRGGTTAGAAPIVD